MAKSKNGGTRSMLRGRVANDVYSIGKDSAGKKQQIVRSLAEQVSNPRTDAQMRGRMIMSTVMQAASQLAVIINHSFDGVTAGQPSISEFIRRNYALIKADVLANYSAGNEFALNLYKEKGIKAGAYVVSDGLVVKPANVVAGENVAVLQINAGASAPTVKEVRESLGVAAGDYFTKVLVLANGTAAYYRVYFGSSLADDTVVTAENAEQLFTVKGNVAVAISFAGSAFTFTPTLSSDVVAHGIIVSQKKGASWIHTTTTLEVVGEPEPAAAIAILSYPTGDERYLNGGDVAGLIDGGAGDANADGGNEGGGAPEEDDNPEGQGTGSGGNSGGEGGAPMDDDDNG